MKLITSRKNLLIIVTLVLGTALLIGCSYVQTGHMLANGNAPGDVSDSLPNPENQSDALKPQKTLEAFGSKTELEAYIKSLAAQSSARSKTSANSANTSSPAENSIAPAGAPMSEDSSSPAKDSKSENESITNTQHAGVDEGGIVKNYGNYLIILRRGRLFTVAVGDDSLTPVSKADAYADDIDPAGTWYDEMLVSGNTIAVIGYSYARGGTEVGLFNIDQNGKLSYLSTYNLRSSDYYSSENYASRLIGSKLIFYAPVSVQLSGADPLAKFPAVRRWKKSSGSDEGWQQTTTPERTYRPAQPVSPYGGLTLHTVTTCDLSTVGRDGNMDCRATAVVGLAGRVFYVSPTSVYVWVTDYNRYQPNQYSADQSKTAGGSRSVIYRLPLDGSAVSALQTSGSPVDQFSFLEGRDGFLNVLVRSEANGDGMWKSKVVSGDTALLRLSVNSFSDGKSAIPASRYRELPNTEGYSFKNRFVGDYLLYGAEQEPVRSSGQNVPNGLYVVRYADGAYRQLKVPHQINRIEPMGENAVIIGNSGSDLYFSPLKLAGDPEIMSPYIQRNSAQGETRSHGFFYKPETGLTGMVGLPIVGNGRTVNEYSDSYNQNGSASVLYIRNDNLSFTELGQLNSSGTGRSSANDNCKASCVDWYGNARPLFLKGRIFALLGYELIEGNISGRRISEKRRINFYSGAYRTTGNNTRVVDGWTVAPIKEN